MNTIETPITDAHAEALADAADFLKEQANEMASLISQKSFADFPSLVETAVRREMHRIRAIEQRLRHLGDSRDKRLISPEGPVITT